MDIQGLRRDGGELLDEPWKSKLMRLMCQVVCQICVRVTERGCVIICIETVLATVEARKALWAIMNYHRVVEIRYKGRPCPDPVVIVGIGAVDAFEQCVVALLKEHNLGSSS